MTDPAAHETRDAPRRDRYDAVVVGSGPNGLAAAITLARENLDVLVVEAADEPGGGARSAELTLPDHVHDVCSAVHPMGLGSPFFRELPLRELGLEWIHPDLPLAHPLDRGRAAVLDRSLEVTARALGRDGPALRKMIGPFVAAGVGMIDDLLAPLRFPDHPLRLARFGLLAMRSARGLAAGWFDAPEARALFAGNAAHSFVPLDKPASAAIGLALWLTAHVLGWPVARGGSGAIVAALVRHLRSLGGEVVTGWRVASIDELPRHDALLLDVAPAAAATIAGERLPAAYRRRLMRFRHGPGAFKLDWALDGPVPWTAEACRRAGTVHLGGTLEEIAEAETAAWGGVCHPRPFVLVAQQSLFDPTRAPEGRHVVWGYAHVPHGSTADPTAVIEQQMERFAPGFRERVVARHALGPADLERHNPNLVGGDIAGGANDLSQMFGRPVLSLAPWGTPARGIYLCSASTPPGGGVHGMCGHLAARLALRRSFGVRRPG